MNDLLYINQYFKLSPNIEAAIRRSYNNNHLELVVKYYNDAEEVFRYFGRGY